jgi:RNA polymerase sigma factor (sigma-70 family)
MSLPDERPFAPGSGSAPRALSIRIEALVDRWGGVIQKAARQYGLSSSDLDEVTQDVRVRLWNLIERDGIGADINATYAWRAASSAAIDLVRRDRLNRGALTVAIESAPIPQAPDDTDLLARLDEALRSLQPSRRVAVRLHLDGSSLSEIATILGWTHAQARNQVYRGLADLKRILGPDEETS